MGGTFDGAHTSKAAAPHFFCGHASTPTRSGPRSFLAAILTRARLRVVMPLQCRSDFFAKLAFGDLAARRPRQFVEDFESLGQQLLGNALLQKVFDERRQIEDGSLV